MCGTVRRDACYRYVGYLKGRRKDTPYVESPKWSALPRLRRGHGRSRPGVRLNEHLEHPDGITVFQHACKMGLEGIVSKRLGSRYRSGRSPDWLKFKNPEAPAVKREAEEDWGR